MLQAFMCSSCYKEQTITPRNRKRNVQPSMPATFCVPPLYSPKEKEGVGRSNQITPSSMFRVFGSSQFTSSTLSVPISSSSGRETLGQFTPSSPKHFVSVTKYSPGSSDTLLCFGGNKGNKVCIPVTWRFTKGSPPPPPTNFKRKTRADQRLWCRESAHRPWFHNEPGKELLGDLRAYTVPGVKTPSLIVSHFQNGRSYPSVTVSPFFSWGK